LRELLLLLGPLLAGGWPFELMAKMRVTPTAAANISARQNRILRRQKIMDHHRPAAFS
jgi:hypothetical protein